MLSQFTQHADYIRFLYGLAFLLVSIVVYSIEKIRIQGPFSGRSSEREMVEPAWRWLALFALLHCTHEWIDVMYENHVGAGFFSTVSDGLIIISFIALLEFVRRSVYFAKKTICLLVLLFGFIVFCAMLNTRGEQSGGYYIFELLRNALRMLGSWGAAWIFFRYRRAIADKAFALFFVIIGLGLYGLSTFFTLRLKANDAQEVLDFAKIAIILCVAHGFWLHYLSLKTKLEIAVFGKKDSTNYWFSVGMTWVVVMGWFGLEILASKEKEYEAQARLSRAEMANSMLEMSLQSAERIVQGLAQDPEVEKILLTPHKQLRRLKNQPISVYGKIFPSAAVYLTDSYGKVVDQYEPHMPRISSPRETLFHSLVQKNNAKPESARFLIYDSESRQPLAFLVQPIFLSEKNRISPRVLGWLFFRVGLSWIQLFHMRGEYGFLVNSSGVVFYSNDSSLHLKTIYPLSTETREYLKKNEWLPDIDFQPLFENEKMASHRVFFRNTNLILWKNPVLAKGFDGWDFIFLTPQKQGNYLRVSVILIVLLICLGIVGIFYRREKEFFTQRELALSEERYRLLFENNQAVMLLVEPLSGQIVSANQAACSFYRYTQDELCSKNIIDLEFKSEKSEVKSSGMIIETTHLLAGGEVRPVELYSTDIAIKNRILHFIVVHDISSRRQIEKEKAKIQAQLFHSEKLATVGVLAAGVAHEVNNPLTIISCYVDVFKNKLEGITKYISDSDYKELIHGLENQHRAIRRISQIINTLRSYARADTDHIEPVDLHKSLSEILSLTEQIYLKSGVTIELHLNAVEPVFKGNHGKIQQVIMNLLNNACDAMKNLPVEKRVIQVLTNNLHGKIELRIIDQGPGVPKELQKRIFEPFFTTKPAGEGTGLGLSICSSIIQDFSGRLLVESEMGQGASFVIQLPMMDEPTEVTRSEQKRAVSLPVKGNALVVDDEPEIVSLLVTLLKEEGLTSVVATDGEAGFENLKNNTFDFVIVDIRMPKIEGDELIKMAKALPTCKNTKFIATSGGILTQYSVERRESIWQLAHAYLRKPFNQVDVAQVLRKAVQSK